MWKLSAAANSLVHLPHDGLYDRESIDINSDILKLRAEIS